MTDYNINSKVFVGGTQDNNLYFMEVRLKNGLFSMSFDEVEPVDVNAVDFVEQARELCNGIDKETLYDMCERYECAPKDLPEALATYEKEEFFFDCMSDPYSISIGDSEFIFDYIGCGQHDPRPDISYFTIPAAIFYEMCAYWDAYHLKKIEDMPPAVVRRIVDFVQFYDNDYKRDITIRRFLKDMVM